MALAVARAFTSSLKKQADPTYAASKSKYFKNVCEFHGLKQKVVEDTLKAHLSSFQALYENEGRAGIHELCKTLLSSTNQEEKCSAPWIMKAVLDKKPSKLGLEDVVFLGKEIFEANHAYDWGTVDTLCGKVIHFALINDGDNSQSGVSKMLKSWSHSQFANLWQQRASCVAFVKLARHGRHTDAIMSIVENCVKNPERFVQLGAGWVLRELWLAEPQLVVNFITGHYTYFSREGLRYAIEKMDRPLQQRLLKYDHHSEGDIDVKSASKPDSDDESDSSSKMKGPKQAKAKKTSTKKRVKEDEEDLDVDFLAPSAKRSKK
jgi:3-methyladenine DNA glycosylase AlkD